MSILVDRKTKLLVQGITGRQAHLNTIYMRAYGTSVVAGVTPGKGGTFIEGTIPVYDSVAQAMENHPEINASVIYVPPRAVKPAALDVIHAGIPLVLITTERCAEQDAMEIIAHAARKNARVIGPNSIGVMSPGQCVVGLIGAKVDIANYCFKEGSVGVISRSGGQTTTLAYYLTRAGYGQSTAVGLGGDSFAGSTVRDMLGLFQNDAETEAVVYFGEVGTCMEEEAAAFLSQGGFKKPLICYVSGQYVLEGVRYGHAGALSYKGIGDVQSKMKKLRESGAVVLDHLDEVATALEKLGVRPDQNKMTSVA